MTVIYYENDANLAALVDKTIGVIGYGSVGQAIAANLRDSSVPLIVGGSIDEQTHAAADGFTTAPVQDVVKRAHILMLLMPDETMTRVYMDAISPYLHRGHTLIFTSAYNVAFGFIEPPPFIDVGLVAPRITGDMLRKHFMDGAGFLSFVAVGQDASHHAWETVLAIARVIGSLKTGAIEVNLEQEAALSLFVQQAVLPTFYHIMTTAARLLMEQGYPSEAVLTDLYLSGKFSDLMRRTNESGLFAALQQEQQAGQYGMFSRLGRFNELKLERLMEVSLEEIRGGKFAQEWASEHADGCLRLKQLLQQQAANDIWELEQQTLEFFEQENPD